MLCDRGTSLSKQLTSACNTSQMIHDRGGTLSKQHTADVHGTQPDCYCILFAVISQT